jgi:SAM-dependent methyltransferase
VSRLRRLRKRVLDRAVIREMRRVYRVSDEPVAIDLGCGKRKAPGYVGIDKVDLPGVDIVCDVATDGIPFPDSSVDIVRAHDVLEHLPNPLSVMNEIYRVLKPYGLADLRVPSTDGRGAFQDPTHVSYWNQNSFDYYVMGYSRDELGYYGIECRFVAERLRTTAKDDTGICWVRARLRAVKP